MERRKIFVLVAGIILISPLGAAHLLIETHTTTSTGSNTVNQVYPTINTPVNTTLKLKIRSGLKGPELRIWNIGLVLAIDVNWSLQINGNGPTHRINMSDSGFIPEIKVWRNARVPLPRIMGIAIVHVIAKAHARNAPEVTLTVNGIIMW